MEIIFKEISELKENTIQIGARKKTKQIDNLMQHMKKLILFLPVKHYDRTLFIEVENCIRIYSSNKKIYVITKDLEYTTHLRLYQLEERLPKAFMRISNTEIINIKCVKQFKLTSSGMIEVHFKNGTITSSSRRYLKQIKERLT